MWALYFDILKLQVLSNIVTRALGHCYCQGRLATLVIIACVVLFLYMACLCRCREDKAQKLNLILGRRPPQISVLQYIFICSTFLLVKFTWVWWSTAIGVGGMSRLERESLGNSASPATSN